MRGTHRLEMAEGGTSQDMERNQPDGENSQTGEIAEGGTSQDTGRNCLSEGHSPPGDSRGRNKSGYRKKPTGQRTLTNLGKQREGQVRTQK